jgi:hypothetical protein
MSELKAGHPPCPKMRRGACQGAPKSHSSFDTEENTETVRELQAASLRRRFAVGYCMSASLAPLIWGVCPR